MKKEVKLWDYAGYICEQIGKGVLVTAKADGQVNPMTIGWGFLGIQWGKPIFTVFVRQSRHTKKLLDACGEFTINVPMDTDVKNILKVCGTQSGRDMDKVKALDLHLEPSDTVSVPGIRELPLTLECKVIYQQDQVLDLLEPVIRERSYPAGTVEENNFHTAYYGQVLASYIITDEEN